MSRIRIKNFGPIKEGCLDNDGWIDIKKVTVFIGNQGSGKSTVAKLISAMTWFEKALNRGDYSPNKVHTALFLNLLQYQRVNNYFNREKTEIEYEGDAYRIRLSPENIYPLVSKTNSKKYIVPQIIYTPSERNFLSTISDAFNIKGIPDNLFSFAEELRKAQYELAGKKEKLPLEGYFYEYNEDEDMSYVSGSNYKIKLLEASSGLQSIIPLYLVSKRLSSRIESNQEMQRKNLTVKQSVRFTDEIMKIMDSPNLNEKSKSEQIELVKSRYFNKCFINIVEEPEQNLFPTSQKSLLFELLSHIQKEGNKLIMTTHSPYLINYLTMAVEANKLKTKVNNEKLKKKLSEIVPLSSTIDGDDLAVYQLNEQNGQVNKLKTYKGLPSDENFLNEGLAESNEEFSKLLEIEDLCR